MTHSPENDARLSAETVQVHQARRMLQRAERPTSGLCTICGQAESFLDDHAACVTRLVKQYAALLLPPHSGRCASDCPTCEGVTTRPGQTSVIPPGVTDEEAWQREHYTVVRSHGCDGPAPECACGSPLTPHRPPSKDGDR